MWTYLITWTVVSIVAAPLVGRFLARERPERAPHAVPAPATPKPLIPAQRIADAPAIPGWRIPRQVYVVTDEPRFRGY